MELKYQRNWRWCSKCQGLAWAGPPDALPGNSVGKCPAGGGHNLSGSWDYALDVIDTALPGVQDNWQYCNKCGGLAFAGNGDLGACPAGGKHVHSGSWNFGLEHDLASPFGQTNWRWCQKCQGLAFAGNGGPGPCPAGGVHNHTISYNYALPVNFIPNRCNCPDVPAAQADPCARPSCG